MKFQPTSPEKNASQPEPCDSDSESHDLLQHEAEVYTNELRLFLPNNFNQRIEEEENQYGRLLFQAKKSRAKRQNQETRNVIEECENQMNFWRERAIQWRERTVQWERKFNEETNRLVAELEKAKKEARDALQEAESAKELLEESIQKRLHHNLFDDASDSQPPPAKKQRTK